MKKIISLFIISIFVNISLSSAQDSRIENSKIEIPSSITDETDVDRISYSEPVIADMGFNLLKCYTKADEYIWKVDGEVIDINTQEIVALKSGVYEVAIKNNNSTSDYSEPVVYTSIYEDNSLNDLNVSYNFFLKTLNFNLNTSTNYYVEIYDCNKKVVYKEYFENNDKLVSLSNLESGVYTLYIFSANQIISKNIII